MAAAIYQMWNVLITTQNVITMGKTMLLKVKSPAISNQKTFITDSFVLCMCLLFYCIAKYLKELCTNITDMALLYQYILEALGHFMQ